MLHSFTRFNSHFNPVKSLSFVFETGDLGNMYILWPLSIFQRTQTITLMIWLKQTIVGWTDGKPNSIYFWNYLMAAFQHQMCPSEIHSVVKSLGDILFSGSNQRWGLPPTDIRSIISLVQFSSTIRRKWTVVEVNEKRIFDAGLLWGAWLKPWILNGKKKKFIKLLIAFPSLAFHLKVIKSIVLSRRGTPVLPF